MRIESAFAINPILSNNSMGATSLEFEEIAKKIENLYDNEDFQKHDDNSEVDYTIGANIQGYKLSVMKEKRPKLEIDIYNTESETHVKVDTIPINDEKQVIIT